VREWEKMSKQVRNKLEDEFMEIVVELGEILINNGADINALSKDNLTPISIAIS